MPIKNELINLNLRNIMETDSVLNIIMATKREQVLKVHPYKITAPSGHNDRWQTSYRDVLGKRKNIKAATETQLLDKLVEIYFSNSYIEKLTFKQLFEEWVDYKIPLVSSPNTIKRYKQHYNRYFASSVLEQKAVKKLDELFLEKECNNLVQQYNLSRKEWTNIKTILNGMFGYAIRKKYVTENPLAQVQIQVKFRQLIKKTGRTETYNSEELEKLNSYLEQMYSETQDSSFMAIKLNFLLGLRVGELVALKWDDIIDNQYIHIVREEIRNQENNVYTVVEHTKTHTDRFVTLVPKAQEILNQLAHESDYLFTRQGNRLTSRQLAYVLEKYAQRNNLSVKSTHKMRKTYASNLSAHQVPLDCIRELLGHSNLNTTLGYIYNPLTPKETYERIKSAL